MLALACVYGEGFARVLRIQIALLEDDGGSVNTCIFSFREHWDAFYIGLLYTVITRYLTDG